MCARTRTLDRLLLVTEMTEFYTKLTKLTEMCSILQACKVKPVKLIFMQFDGLLDEPF